MCLIILIYKEGKKYILFFTRIKIRIQKLFYIQKKLKRSNKKEEDEERVII